jgi:hypothetical protein
VEVLLAWLRDAPLWQTVPAALAENLLLHGVAIAMGEAASWDRLFRTLRREYWARFVKLPS